MPCLVHRRLITLRTTAITDGLAFDWILNHIVFRIRFCAGLLCVDECSVSDGESLSQYIYAAVSTTDYERALCFGCICALFIALWIVSLQDPSSLRAVSFSDHVVCVLSGSVRVFCSVLVGVNEDWRHSPPRTTPIIIF